MENLARSDYDKQADEKVKEELLIAGVPVMKTLGCMDGEVKTHYIGILNGFIFERAWTYWVVRGWMPLEHAKYIYENYKELQIRAGGDCGNENPELPHIFVDPAYMKRLNAFLDEVGQKEYVRMYTEGCFPVHENPDDPKFIQVYHVDTQLGLCKLSEVIKQFDIHTEFVE